MIKSYRIFISRTLIKGYTIYTAVVFAALVVFGIAGRTASPGLVKNLANSLAPVFCMVLLPVCSVVSLAQIYNANLLEQPAGYRYFHSLGNAAEHFLGAVIFGNLISVVLIIPFGGVLMLLYQPYNILMLIFYTLLTLGIANLCGHIPSVWARIVPPVALGTGLGLYWAIFDNGKTSPNTSVVVITGTVSIVFYLAGLIFAVAKAKSVWDRTPRLFNSSDTAVKSSAKPEKILKISQKQHFQSGAYFLTRSILRFPHIGGMAVILLIAVVMGVLPFIGHEPIGSQEYLFPKVFIYFPSFFLTEMALICISRDLAGNKVIYSLPMAKKLFTRSVPALIVLLTLGLTAVMLCVYFIFLDRIGAEVSQFSDTLFIGAAMCACILCFSPYLMKIPAGGVLLIYTAVVPIVLLRIIYGKGAKAAGFGVPLHISIVLFAAVAVLGSVWVFYASAREYRKTGAKINPAMGLNP